jgi:hypothetical protein
MLDANKDGGSMSISVDAILGFAGSPLRGILGSRRSFRVEEVERRAVPLQRVLLAVSIWVASGVSGEREKTRVRLRS